MNDLSPIWKPQDMSVQVRHTVIQCRERNSSSSNGPRLFPALAKDVGVAPTHPDGEMACLLSSMACVCASIATNHAHAGVLQIRDCCVTVFAASRAKSWRSRLA